MKWEKYDNNLRTITIIHHYGYFFHVFLGSFPKTGYIVGVHFKIEFYCKFPDLYFYVLRIFSKVLYFAFTVIINFSMALWWGIALNLPFWWRPCMHTYYTKFKERSNHF